MESAMDLLDRRDRIERALLQVLKRQHNQYYNAFQNISRNTRFIYVHAYQSFVWNRAVTSRLQKFGRQVLIGDLVIRPDKSHLVDN
jgi:tRNA pseudouridine13 synthase